MKASKIVLCTLLITSAISFYYHYLNYQSFTIQDTLLEDIRMNNFTNKDYEFIKKINYDYPTLNQTAIPIKAIAGHYYLGIDSIQKGLDLLYGGIKDNPFLNYSEAVLADYFYSVKKIDSFNKYTRKIMREIPNSPVHFVLFSKMLMMEEKIDSVLITFENTIRNQKIKDFQTWKVFLAAMNNNYKDLDSLKIKNYAIEAKKLFPENDEIRLLADYLLFSELKVKKSQSIYDEGIFTFNDNKELGIKLLKESIDLYPGNLLAKKNLIKAYFYNEQWQETINSYSIYSEDVTIIDFESVFFYASSLMNIGDKSSSCGVFQYLTDNKYSIPVGIKSECQIQ